MSALQTSIFIICLTVITAEWIEITQKPKSSNYSKAKADIYEQHQTQEPLTPSPEWIEYQRERFSDKSETNSQQLIINANQHLKNSAQVIVTPASAVRNKVVQVKTRIDVTKHQLGQTVMDKIEPQLAHENVQTTPRRDMSYDEETGTESMNAGTLNDAEDAEGEAEAEEMAGADESNTNANGVEYPSVKGFFTFLKSIQKSWLKKSGFSIEQKINMLKKLRDKLMRTIEKRFTTLWQPGEHLRQKRGILDESNLNFPPEAALMSINFLTFAVFLIKLVLQVVHIIKSKHYSFTGLGVNAERIGKTTLRH